MPRMPTVYPKRRWSLVCILSYAHRTGRPQDMLALLRSRSRTSADKSHTNDLFPVDAAATTDLSTTDAVTTEMVALRCPSDVYFAATKLILLDHLGERSETIASKSQIAVIFLVAFLLPTALLVSYSGLLTSVDGYGGFDEACYGAVFWYFMDENDKHIQGSGIANMARAEMGTNASTIVELWQLKHFACRPDVNAQSTLSLSTWLVITISALVAAGIVDVDLLARAKSVRLAMSVQAKTPWIWISREVVMLTNHLRLGAATVTLSVAPVLVLADGAPASIALNFAAMLILLDAGNMILTPVMGERAADKLCEKPLHFTKREETAFRRGSSVFYVGIFLMCATIKLAPAIGYGLYIYLPGFAVGGLMILRDFLLARNCKEACYLLVTWLVAGFIGYFGLLMSLGLTFIFLTF